MTIIKAEPSSKNNLIKNPFYLNRYYTQLELRHLVKTLGGRIMFLHGILEVQIGKKYAGTNVVTGYETLFQFENPHPSDLWQLSWYDSDRVEIIAS